jgi:hypothetical protein
MERPLSTASVRAGAWVGATLLLLVFASLMSLAASKAR